MLYFHSPNATPWIIILIFILLVLAFFAWLGFDNWSELR